jgi:hypothetical protein
MLPECRMQINLRRLDVLMAEHVLETLEISTVLKVMTRECVP